jgi:hypothetical protein
MSKYTIALILLICFNLTTNHLWAQNSPFGEDGVYISLHAGGTINRFKAGKNIDYLKFSPSIQPYISGLIDFDLVDCKNCKAISGLIIRIEMSYRPMNVKANGNISIKRHSEYEIKAHAFVPTVSILYGIPLIRKLRIYAGIGVGWVYTNTSINRLTSYYHYPSGNYNTDVKDNSFELMDDNAGVIFSIGLLYKKRFDLNCSVLRSTWTSQQDLYNEIINRSTSISLGYRF